MDDTQEALLLRQCETFRDNECTSIISLVSCTQSAQKSPLDEAPDIEHVKTLLQSDISLRASVSQEDAEVL